MKSAKIKKQTKELIETLKRFGFEERSGYFGDQYYGYDMNDKIMYIPHRGKDLQISVNDKSEPVQVFQWILLEASHIEHKERCDKVQEILGAFGLT